MSHQLVAETSTWQHTTLTTEKYPCPRWDSKPRSQQASGLRPLACWDRVIACHKVTSLSYKLYSACFLGLKECFNVRTNVTKRRVEKRGSFYIVSGLYSLLTQHANCMNRIMLSSVTCPAPPYVSTLCHKSLNFWKKFNMNCVFWFF